MTKHTRRRFLALGGAAALGSVAGCAEGSQQSDNAASTDTQTPSRETPAEANTPGTETPGTDPTATSSAEERPLSRQLSTVREATERYRGTDGIDRAFADGFEPAGPPRNTWTLVRPPLPDEVDILDPPTLIYVLEDGAIRLGAVGYGVPYEESGSPDVFNDEDEDLPVTESEGWLGANNTVYAAFSNGDDAVDDVTDLPKDTLLDPGNWAWTDKNPGTPGDEFDIDGDDEPEVLDYVFERPPVWALHVWVHLDNECGVFDFIYGDDTCGTP